MSDLYKCSAHLLTSHNFWVALGQVIVVAMVIGAMLDESWKRLRNWVLAGIIFAAVEQYIRYSFRSNLGFDNGFLCESNSISVLVALTYAIGVTSGWMIVYFGKQHGRKNYQKELEKKENAK